MAPILEGKSIDSDQKPVLKGELLIWRRKNQVRDQGRQQAMGGRGCGKYSMERRSKMLHDAIRRGAQGQKKGGLLFFC